MFYAIIEQGGKQYRVEPGQTIRVEKLALPLGEEIELGKVLLVASDQGVKVGTPYLPGAKVRATVTGEGKARKVYAFKYKAKEDYRRRVGHRQNYTLVSIGEIVTG